ncbi:MAG: Amino acid transporter [uncultured Acidilobus sp. OSP8]|jgi:Amino acid transporters|nr:MAG: Amino acid transporter [uncultured Acidilobus sp. OSP8]
MAGERPIAVEKAEATDKQLRRALNFWDIAYLVIGAMIGSGWLFGSLYAAAMVGPGAILSWLVAGVLMLFIALAFAELAGMIPKSGAIVRYPQYSHGSLTSFMLAWAYLLSAITVAPAEAEAVVTYMGSYVPGLLTPTGVLTAFGLFVAFLFTVFFFLLNYFGVHVMGKTNTGVGWWKLLVPLITIVLLLALYLHPSNFTTPSLLPYGAAPLFFALPTTGIVFAYLGFRQGLEYGGEAKNPQRDVPLGTVIGFLIVVAIYVLLQTAFVGGVDWSKLVLNVSTGSSWKLVPVKPGQWGNLTSALVNIAGYPSLSHGPFYEILRMSAIPILVGWGIFLLIDAIVSPSGTGWIYEGTATRTFYGMAADGHLPDWFLWLNKYKVPWVSLLASLVVGALFLIPYPAWVYIASFISSTTVYTYMIGGPAVLVLRRTAPQAPRPFRLPAAWVIGALAFIAAFLIVYWSTFAVLWGVVALILAGLPLFFMYTLPSRYGFNRSLGAAIGVVYWFVLGLTTYFFLYQDVVQAASTMISNGVPIHKVLMATVPYFIYWLVINMAVTIAAIYVTSTKLPEEGKQHIRAGWWIVITTFVGLILSFLGPFGPYASANYAIIPFPWDTVTAAVVALVLFFWAAYSGIYTKDLEIVLRDMGIIK